MGQLNRAVACFTFGLALAAAVGAGAELSVELGGRGEYGLEAEKTAAQFPWNVSSRSLSNKTRLMLDLRAALPGYGEAYAKGTAAWARPGVLQLELEQGDYLWSPAGYDSSCLIRLFANERRYFTGEMSEPLLDDDTVVERDVFRRRSNYGGRFDGAWGGRFRGSALASTLGRRWEDASKFYYLRLGTLGRNVQASASYVFDSPRPDSLGNHAVVKGEASAFYKKMSLVVSYEQSGYDDRAVFFPSGRFDWDGFVGNNFSSSLPGAAAAFAELRLGAVPFRELGFVTFVHRYRALGGEYVNEFGPLGRAAVSRSSGLYFAAKDVAVNGRLVYTKSAQRKFGINKRERIEAGLQGMLKNGSEVILRAASSRTAYLFPADEKDNFVHASLRRSDNKIASGVHVMIRNIDGYHFDRRFAVDARFNWTTELSVYCRLITSDEYTSHDAVFGRIELRPADHVFATFSYGRDFIGDGPFLLEDADIRATGGTDPVYTLMLRGDF